MRRAIGPILGLLLILELAVAAGIVMNTPEGFGGLVNFGFGPERRQELPVQTFNIDQQIANLVINNSAGRVVIEGSDTATTVTVNATKIIYGFNDEGFSRLNYQITQNGNTINVTAEQPVKPNIGFTGHVDIQITAPRNAYANIKTGSGDVRVNGLQNADQLYNFETGSGNVTASTVQGSNLRVKTGSGDVRLDTLTGALNAETGSGNIILNGLQGQNSRLKTGSGDVRLENVTAALDAETNSGNIEVMSSNVTGLRMKTGSGNVRFNGQATISSDTQVSTGSGNVQLDFNNLGATPPRFDISTGSGSINFNVKGVSIGQNDKHHLTTNNSGSMLRINTGSGDVRITG